MKKYQEMEQKKHHTIWQVFSRQIAMMNDFSLSDGKSSNFSLTELTTLELSGVSNVNSSLISSLSLNCWNLTTTALLFPVVLN